MTRQINGIDVTTVLVYVPDAKKLSKLRRQQGLQNRTVLINKMLENY